MHPVVQIIRKKNNLLLHDIRANMNQPQTLFKVDLVITHFRCKCLTLMDAM